MAWRLAKSLERLRAQVNAAAPNRDKSADGSIGDAAHSSRTSDHNPNPSGVVCAIDITHDPDGGLDSYALAETLKASGDKRLKYIISNGRIWNPPVAPGWRKYTGSNPHNHHVHVSVKSALADDTSDWAIGLKSKGILERAIVAVADVIAPPPPKYPTLKRGDKGEEVRRLQRLLDFAAKDIDGDFGRRTEMAVKAFQRSKKLTADGIVGVYTFKALGA
jgi:hypothetical protein